MLVFIDDSGDPGFKLERGSSSFFVIAMIIFDDELEAEKTAVAIKDLRRKLKFPDDVEFKFFKSHPKVRREFLKTVADFHFRVRALVVDKKTLRSPLLRGDKESFYAYFIKTALRFSDGSIHEAKIRIDGSGERAFRRQFLSYLRRELNSVNNPLMAQCRLVDSRENVLIQLADMVAGSIHRAHRPDKKDRTEYRAIIKKRIEDEWPFQ